MKSRYILPLAALALPALAGACLVSPHPVEMVSADGSKIEITAHGNFEFSYFSDAAGRIMEHGSDGIWRQVTLDGRALTTSAADVELLRRASEPQAGSTAARVRKMQSQHRLIQLDGGRTTFPSLENDIHCLVVLLEYADTPFATTDPRQAFDDLCNKQGYDAYNSRGSVRDYYLASSDGKFAPTFDVVGPVKLKNDAAFYAGYDVWVETYNEYVDRVGGRTLNSNDYAIITNEANQKLNGAGKNARFGEAIKEAMDQLVADGTDFKKYDRNNDGELDTVVFMYSGYGQADYFYSDDIRDADGYAHRLIWPHETDFRRYTKEYGGWLDPIYVDGLRLGSYSCSNELNGKHVNDPEPFMDGIGAFCHEFGHVLGLPDLYDTHGNSPLTPGKWSVMAQGSYNDDSTCPPLFSAYEKWVCRWLEYEDAVDGTSYDLTAAADGDAKAIRIRIPRRNGTFYPDEYYVVESRSRKGFDSELPGEGLLFWHIDYDKTAWENNTVNTDATSPRVGFHYPTDGVNDVAWPVAFGDAAYICADNRPLTANHAAPTFNPVITGITYDPETGIGSFGYNLVTEKPTLTTHMWEMPWRNTDRERTFTLAWNPVEGAESYLVTVYRRDASGNIRYIDSYEERNVGNVTTTDVYVALAGAWDENVWAYVRVFSKLPSSEKSNEIKFVPSELGTQSAVGEITGDAPLQVTAGKGFITAPEGAQVFSINGVATGTDNLPAGVYIVRHAGKSAKVMVR